MKLAPHDRQNPLWLKLKAHYEERLATLRKQNDGDQDAEKTAAIRGRIREVKEFLEMGVDGPVVAPAPRERI